MTTPTQSQDELKQNYCFWCSSYGSTNWPLCVNCGNKIGSVPPAVQAHIDKAVALARVEGASKFSEDDINKIETVAGYLQPLYDGLDVMLQTTSWHFLPGVIEEVEEWIAELQSQRVALVGEDK